MPLFKFISTSLSNSPWFTLFLAGLFEVGWAIGLKYTDGYTKLLPTLWTLAMMVIGLFLLGRATQVLPIGTAYAVWVGIGSIGASILGIFLFHESTSLPRLFFLLLLIVSIIGLKVTSTT
jgi:quaternary ammonium compound-resistance protein SugE